MNESNGEFLLIQNCVTANSKIDVRCHSAYYYRALLLQTNQTPHSHHGFVLIIVLFAFPPFPEFSMRLLN